MSTFNSRLIRSLFQLATTVLALGMINVTLADGLRLWVSNRGVDSPSCGNTINTACRSISQAIENATEGDTLVVQAGVYGDLNADGDLDDPGEEHLDPTGEICVVCVTKRLRIFSQHGAAVTIINVPKITSPSLQQQRVVRIDASGVIFGAKDRGFTITGSNVLGLYVNKAEDVRVAGNVIIGAQYRFETEGSLVVSDNLAIGPGILSGTSGFSVSSGFSRVIVQNNTVIGGSGFHIRGANLQVLDNVATNNVTFGFSILGGNVLAKGNSAINNGGGFAMGLAVNDTPPNITFIRNRVTGNLGPGISLIPGISNLQIHENNIYGNGTARPSFFDPQPPQNCGVFAGFAGIADRVADVRNNYWGSPKGPGDDPADNTGFQSGCDPRNKVTFEPYSTIPFPIGS